MVKKKKISACNAGDTGSIPGWGGSPGEVNGNPLQYSCLENSLERGAQRATIHGVANRRTQLSNYTFSFTNIMVINVREEEMFDPSSSSS